MEPQASGAATRYESALADEILAEVARRRVTSKSVQEAAGVKPRAWTNYLTARTREIPMAVVIRICDALDMAPSEMLRRAEARAADLAAHEAGPRIDVDPIEAELIAGMSPRNQRVVADGVAPAAPSSERPTRDHRSA